jgi:uncharacterized protein YjeT (DUF2065 family)
MSIGDLIVGLGLVLVIEGLVWALAPNLAARLLETMAQMSEGGVRIAGAVSVALGVVVVWLVRG